MKTTAKFLCNAVLAGVILAGTGCRHGLTTALVWEIGQYHPARIPRLQLSTAPGTNDVLVQYDECFASSKTLRPRAYWLYPYVYRDSNPVERPKPKFVNPETIPNLTPIKLLCSSVVATNGGYSARQLSNERAFELWHDGAPVGQFELPVYSNAPPVTWGRVALTPVTVATDAAILTVLAAGRGGAGFGR